MQKNTDIIRCIAISDASIPPLGYKIENNGKFSLWCLTVVHGMGMGELGHKYMGKDFDDIAIFESWNLTTYIALKSKGGWGMIRVDGDYNSVHGLISEVTDKLYPTFSELQLACSEVFFHYAHLQAPNYYEHSGQCYETHKVCDGITPAKITRLRPHDVFVFGSNLSGKHVGGAARTAHKYFGAKWGVGEGHTGQTYAIPTTQGGVQAIKQYVDRFIQYTKEHPELHFLVTPIGCGIASYTPEEIAPLFKDLLDSNNVNLPNSFINIINSTHQ